MKKRAIATMLVCGLCVSMLSGCGEEESSSSRREKKSDKNKTESTKELSDILGGLFGKEEDVWDPVATPVPETTPSATEEVWSDEWIDEEPTYPVEEDYPEEEEWEIYDPTVPEYEDEVIIDEFPDPVLCDPTTGKPYDLGGMEIIVRNWWSPEEAPIPTNEYEEARDEYRDWIQETYNFTIREVNMSDWASVPMDFVDYVATGGDEKNYIFTLREDPTVTAAMNQGFMYDLSVLDCLDFTEAKFAYNKVHEMYAKDGRIYAMNSGFSEPRCGMWFNKRVLEEAGIDPESIYDMQAAGTWTWDAWTDIMEKVQRDINGDGVIDVYGMDANYNVPALQAIYSNGSELVGMEDGNYVYKIEDPATVEALEWIADVFKNYGLVRPEDAYWDYYKEAFLNGYVAFCPDEAYMGMLGQVFSYTMDEIGFVMFPKGPRVADYVNCWSNNHMVIPACYDSERAWKIAFAWDLYTTPTPGYEDYIDISQYRNGNFDSRAVDETIVSMMYKGMITYHTLIPNLDIYGPFLYKFGLTSNVAVSDLIELNRETYKYWINEANN